MTDKIDERHDLPLLKQSINNRLDNFIPNPVEKCLLEVLRHTYYGIVGSSNDKAHVAKNPQTKTALSRYFFPRNGENIVYTKTRHSKGWNTNQLETHKGFNIEFDKTAYKYNYDNLTSSMQNLVVNAACAVKVRYGNCNTISSYAAWLLWQMADKPNSPIHRIEHVSLENSFLDHVVLVINRKSGRLEDPTTWGNECWIFDGWRVTDEDKRVYPARDFVRNMHDLYIKVNNKPSRSYDFKVYLKNEIEPRQQSHHAVSNIINSIDFYPLEFTNADKALLDMKRKKIELANGLSQDLKAYFNKKATSKDTNKPTTDYWLKRQSSYASRSYMSTNNIVLSNPQNQVISNYNQQLSEAVIANDSTKLSNLMSDIEKQTQLNIDSSLLHLAVTHGSLHVLELLLNKFPSQVNALDKNGKTPIQIAIPRATEVSSTTTNAMKILRLLIEKGADVNAVDSYNRNPLYVAVQANDIETVRWLIAKGVNLDKQNSGKWTPLNYAVDHNYTAITNELVNAGANLNLSNNEQMTPLHYAVEDNNWDKIELLLSKGADATLKNKQGQTAIELAHAKYFTLIELIFDEYTPKNGNSAQAFPSSKFTNRDHDNENILDLAINHRPEAIGKILIKALDFSAEEQKSLLSAIKNGMYDNVLQYAINETPELISALILHIKQTNNTNLIKQLLELTDTNKKSALMIVTIFGDIEAVDTLIKFGADGNAQDIDNTTASDYAFEYNRTLILQKLHENIVPIVKQDTISTSNDNKKDTAPIQKPVAPIGDKKVIPEPQAPVAPVADNKPSPKAKTPDEPVADNKPNPKPKTPDEPVADNKPNPKPKTPDEPALENSEIINKLISETEHYMRYLKQKAYKIDPSFDLLVSNTNASLKLQAIQAKYKATDDLMTLLIDKQNPSAAKRIDNFSKQLDQTLQTLSIPRQPDWIRYTKNCLAILGIVLTLVVPFLVYSYCTSQSPLFFTQTKGERFIHKVAEISDSKLVI